MSTCLLFKDSADRATESNTAEACVAGRPDRLRSVTARARSPRAAQGVSASNAFHDTRRSPKDSPHPLTTAQERQRTPARLCVYNSGGRRSQGVRRAAGDWTPRSTQGGGASACDATAPEHACFHAVRSQRVSGAELPGGRVTRRPHPPALTRITGAARGRDTLRSVLKKMRKSTRGFPYHPSGERKSVKYIYAYIYPRRIVTLPIFSFRKKGETIRSPTSEDGGKCVYIYKYIYIRIPYFIISNSLAGKKQK